MTVIVDGKMGPVQKEKRQPGVCPCGALVCLSCQSLLDPETADDHACAAGDSMDAATLSILANNSNTKKCPVRNSLHLI